MCGEHEVRNNMCKTSSSLSGLCRPQIDVIILNENLFNLIIYIISCILGAYSKQTLLRACRKIVNEHWACNYGGDWIWSCLDLGSVEVVFTIVWSEIN